MDRQKIEAKYAEEYYAKQRRRERLVRDELERTCQPIINAEGYIIGWRHRRPIINAEEDVIGYFD